MTACLCGREKWQVLWQYDTPPAGETSFKSLPRSGRRDIVRCENCGHCRAVHDLSLEGLYKTEYMAATYGNNLRAVYDRIMALPVEQSDNAGRVTRLTAVLGSGRGRRVLDVGSGLGVFLARMKDEGWAGTALDPDARAVEHAREVVGVAAIQADWLNAAIKEGSYDLVAFNKVIEHIEEPVDFLTKARRAVASGGNVYVEVPDGEAAAAAGPEREEFFIEHWHMFSPISLLCLLRQSGLNVRLLERLREPSGKFTLRALAEGGAADAGYCSDNVGLV